MNTFRTDDDGNPAGGDSSGIGYMIRWQDGPLGGEGERNGAFLIEVLEECEVRLEFYQNSKFRCDENKLALTALSQCLTELQTRRERRLKAGTLGTHKVE